MSFLNYDTNKYTLVFTNFKRNTLLKLQITEKLGRRIKQALERKLETKSREVLQYVLRVTPEKYPQDFLIPCVHI